MFCEYESGLPLKRNLLQLQNLGHATAGVHYSGLSNGYKIVEPPPSPHMRKKHLLVIDGRLERDMLVFYSPGVTKKRSKNVLASSKVQ